MIFIIKPAKPGPGIAGFDLYTVQMILFTHADQRYNDQASNQFHNAVKGTLIFNEKFLPILNTPLRPVALFSAVYFKRLK